jgi:hypothetical protein
MKKIIDNNHRYAVLEDHLIFVYQVNIKKGDKYNFKRKYKLKINNCQAINKNIEKIFNDLSFYFRLCN